MNDQGLYRAFGILLAVIAGVVLDQTIVQRAWLGLLVVALLVFFARECATRSCCCQWLYIEEDDSDNDDDEDGPKRVRV